MDHPEKKRASPSDMDGDGVRITEYGTRASRWSLVYKMFALILAGGCVAYLLMAEPAPSETGKTTSDEPASNRSGVAATQSTSLETTAVPRRDVTPPSEPPQDTSLDLSDVVPPGMAPTAAEVIEELHKAGIHSGIGAFNPPGTSPPLIGLAVPEDFALPEGYVRHYQATDDGQRIEPILMFSPDFEFFDSAGRRIEIPADRVVPPGMAPSGLTIRRITIPPPLPTGKPSI